MKLRLADIEGWYASRGWRVLPYQRKVWRAYRAGKSGLVHAPTGTGKTLAAWFGPLWMHARQAPGRTPPVTVLWVTPLRALATDTCESLRQPVADLELSWEIGLRTGDTPAGIRARQRKRLPTALVTTPESLSLLLSYGDTAKQLKTHLQAVVVDEWHELLGSKRGVLLQLALAHLRAANPDLRTWGLSATMGNVAQAAEVLLGHGAEPCVVRGVVPKRHQIRSIIPDDIHAFPLAGHGGRHLLPKVVEQIEQAGTTLLFTNTRSQAEAWFAGLLKARDDWIGQIALHHGSLSTDIRRQVEGLLRAGRLRCVVATSSLDLGVDFTPVEQVLQVGSPKGVARLLQRAGRSGHQPGAVSAVHCVPTHALQLLEIAAAREAASAARLEAREPPTLCLDVLAQHLVTLSLAGGVDAAPLFEEAQATHAFRELTQAHWQWIITFLTRGGPVLDAYPQFQKLIDHDGRLVPANATVTRRHRMAVGTITSDAMVRVRFERGATLGHIEERFLTRLKPGESFQFAGRTLALKRLRDMTAWVKLAGGRARVPRWAGGRMPLSSELGEALLELFHAVARGRSRAPEVRAMAPLLEVQAARSALPNPHTLLMERTRSREGVHLFLFPFAGRLVHEGLAALLAWRLSRRAPATFSLSVNDYGLELLCPEPFDFDREIAHEVLSREQLVEHVLSAVNASEMARRQFRDIARISGLVFSGYPGAPKSQRQIQSSSGLMFDVLSDHDPDHELLAQARREVLSQQFEIARLGAVLDAMSSRHLKLVDTARLTPLAFPLWADRLAARVSSERWLDRVTRMRERVMQIHD